MVTRDEIYGTLHSKRWKCKHEINEELDTSGIGLLEEELSSLYIQNQPEVILSTIETYLTACVDERVAEARIRGQQTEEQIQLCGIQQRELEYRLLPQEIKKRSGTEAGKSGEYAGVR